MKKINISVVIVMMITMFACTSRKAVQSDVQVDDATTEPEIVMSGAVDGEGESIYQTRCTSCHYMKDPKRFSEDQLRKIVPKMVAKVNKDDVLISDSEHEILLAYLIYESKQ